jgi:hypothetical protein
MAAVALERTTAATGLQIPLSAKGRVPCFVWYHLSSHGFNVTTAPITWCAWSSVTANSSAADTKQLARHDKVSRPTSTPEYPASTPRVPREYPVSSRYTVLHHTSQDKVGRILERPERNRQTIAPRS